MLKKLILTLCLAISIHKANACTQEQIAAGAPPECNCESLKRCTGWTLNGGKEVLAALLKAKNFVMPTDLMILNRLGILMCMARVPNIPTTLKQCTNWDSDSGKCGLSKCDSSTTNIVLLVRKAYLKNNQDFWAALPELGVRRSQ